MLTRILPDSIQQVSLLVTWPDGSTPIPLIGFICFQGLLQACCISSRSKKYIWTYSRSCQQSGPEVAMWPGLIGTMLGSCSSWTILLGLRLVGLIMGQALVSIGPASCQIFKYYIMSPNQILLTKNLHIYKLYFKLTKI